MTSEVHDRDSLFPEAIPLQKALLKYILYLIPPERIPKFSQSKLAAWKPIDTNNLLLSQVLGSLHYLLSTNSSSKHHPLYLQPTPRINSLLLPLLNPKPYVAVAVLSNGFLHPIHSPLTSLTKDAWE